MTLETIIELLNCTRHFITSLNPVPTQRVCCCNLRYQVAVNVTDFLQMRSVYFTISKFPLRYAFNFSRANQQFQPSSSVLVLELLTNVAFRQLLQINQLIRSFSSVFIFVFMPKRFQTPLIYNGS